MRLSLEEKDEMIKVLETKVKNFKFFVGKTHDCVIVSVNSYVQSFASAFVWVGKFGL